MDRPDAGDTSPTPSASEHSPCETAPRKPAVRRPPVPYVPYVGAVSARSTELLEHEMPNEVLAWIFLFVRGPPASGALVESRRVCKRWREIISAHVKEAPPRTFYNCYQEAYRLGYLSPPGLMPLPDKGEPMLSRIRTLIVWVEEEHDANLFSEIRGMVDYYFNKANLLNETAEDVERNNLLITLEQPSVRVASGFWDDLTVENIQKHVEYIHPLDVPRATRMGVVLSDENLAECFVHYCRDEKNFIGWSDEQLRAGSITPHNDDDREFERLETFAWLMQRGALREVDMELWMESAIECAYQGRNKPLLAICEAIVARGWQNGLTAAILTCGNMYIGPEVIGAVMRACPEVVRRSAWRETIEGRPYAMLDEMSDRWPPVCVAQDLDTFWEHGMFHDATSEDTSRLLCWYIDTRQAWSCYEVAKGGYSEDLTGVIKWVLAHLPLPTTTIVLRTLSLQPDHELSVLLPAFFQRERHLPWHPLELVFMLPEDDDGESGLDFDFIKTLLENGYCLPSIIDVPEDPPLDDQDCRSWLEVFKLVETRPSQREGITFTAEFVRQARTFNAGLELLEKLDELGVRY